VNFRTLKLYSDDIAVLERRFEKRENAIGMSLKASNAIFAVTVPHWLAAIMALTLAVGPWIRWKFRLRTLLIATALIGVALGIIVAI
jgi:hypothetical protein